GGHDARPDRQRRPLRARELPVGNRIRAVEQSQKSLDHTPRERSRGRENHGGDVMSVSAYPLQWPAGRPRKTSRKRATFGKKVHNGRWTETKDLTVADSLGRL